MTPPRLSPRASERLAHDDLPTVAEMQSDVRAAGAALRLDRAARRVTGPTPSIRFADYPHEVPKTEITVSAAALRLANALSLHLD